MVSYVRLLFAGFFVCFSVDSQPKFNINSAVGSGVLVTLLGHCLYWATGWFHNNQNCV